MIRFRRLPLALLNAWLIDQQLPSSHRRYRLRIWREDRAQLNAIRNELSLYMEEAFEDARTRIRRGFEDDLSPFNDPKTDPAANYPTLLHRVTLQGYLGETLAVIAVEHWGAHGHSDWVVPALLFRLHDQEFQHLEAINERILNGEVYNPDRVAEQRPGRTGDDAIAFRITDENIITDVLTIEAKCVSRNNNEKIKEAHQKLAAGGSRPSAIRELINIMDEYETPDAARWQEALLKLWRDGHRNAQRYDSIAYACGRTPARAGRVSWMPDHAPHADYTAARNLEGMEFQFSGLDDLVDFLYRAK
jgi:hypothetical protein